MNIYCLTWGAPKTSKSLTHDLVLKRVVTYPHFRTPLYKITRLSWLSIPSANWPAVPGRNGAEVSEKEGVNVKNQWPLGKSVACTLHRTSSFRDMHEWMNEWIDGRTDGCMDGWMNGWMEMDDNGWMKWHDMKWKQPWRHHSGPCANSSLLSIFE